MVTEFKGEFSWLSNFYPVRIEFRGKTYASVEHAYMSAKSDSLHWKRFCQDPTKSASQVKKASYNPNIIYVEGWEEKKLQVMEECLREKFKHAGLREKLVATGHTVLSEGNHHGDTFWGFCLKTNFGQDHLGRLLMKIRRELQHEVETV